MFLKPYLYLCVNTISKLQTAIFDAYFRFVCLTLSVHFNQEVEDCKLYVIVLRQQELSPQKQSWIITIIIIDGGA